MRKRNVSILSRSLLALVALMIYKFVLIVTQG